MTDKTSVRECLSHVALRELRSLSRVQARNKTTYFHAYGSKLPTRK